MAPASPSARRTPTGRRPGRPPGTATAARPTRHASAVASISSEPPLKKRRYIPGGSGGGGRFLEGSDADSPAPTSAITVSRTRPSLRNTVSASSPATLPRRERSTRARRTASDDSGDEGWGSAAAMAASVKQAEDYKPREERGWEDFHPNLDIEAPLVVFRADEVDGLASEPPATPTRHTPGTPFQDSTTPSRFMNPASTGNTPNPQSRSETNPFESANGTPSRRSRRSTAGLVSFYTPRPAETNTTPRTPKILPIQTQTAKERLDLKLPSYRKTNRIELFESKTFGQARYVDKSMSNVGYQESDQFLRPDRDLIKAVEGIFDDDMDLGMASNAEDHHQHARLGRVEYDMDEQDDMWLESYNLQRKQHDLETITREIFEITMTKIEKEWHALERRIPKPNPKPPQTHRPRSGSAAAVNGEQGSGEEPDSKCAICDDGDCENTNAIVFCDGCNLAVHQECYGVPFIPEGQWLCRKCQLCGRGVPTCIFCPNTDGAFKQTNSSKWAHLLCAMWIPEVSLGNHTFMEPVMDVEKVPRTRWKLSCYICHQKMGACIQCSNKNCYQAFHVTCARRARLFLKMKTSQGALAVLDGSMILRAFCDKHCSPDYTQENNVHQATRAAKKFYKRNMRGRIWADNHTVANVIAAQHRNALMEHPPDESEMTGAKNSAVLGDKKKGSPPKNVWKLPSGAPIIPQAVFENVESSIQRFPFRKRKDFLGEACRYWTLKREARRGAALLKRLQLQMESFSSMELTRRNFASMGASGKARLARRIEFAEALINDLGQLKDLSDEVVERERLKHEAVELEQGFVDECYFPAARFLVLALDKAISLDKNLFADGLEKLQAHISDRFYVTALSFATELGEAINAGINTDPKPILSGEADELAELSPSKHSFADVRERRKLGRRILKAVQPFLETALRIESEISSKSFEGLQKELEALFESSIERPPPQEDMNDTIMVDAPSAAEITVKSRFSGTNGLTPGETMDTVEGGNIEVNTSGLGIVQNNGTNGLEKSKDTSLDGSSETPPDSNGFMSLTRSAQAGPPTPPQSNGSLGKQPLDTLTDGGVLWYLKAYKPHGTSIVQELWAGRDAVRMLSEDLTDLDDDELKGLGADVNESVRSAIAEAEAEAVVGEDTEMLTPRSAKRRASTVKKRRTSGRRR